MQKVFLLHRRPFITTALAKRAVVWLAAAAALGAALAQAQSSPMNLEQAEATYRTQLAQDTTDVKAAAQLAQVLEAEGQNKAAIHFWQRAIALKPADRYLQNSLADAYLGSGQNEKAAALYQQLLKTMDSAPDARMDRGAMLLNLGAALARSGNFEQARQTYLTATSIPAVADSATLSLIKVLVTLSRFQQAEPYAEHYGKAHPHAWEGCYFQGLIASRLGHENEAEVLLRRAVALDPKQYDAQLSLGAVLREEGKDGEAIASLKQAVALRPEATDGHFQLGRAYRAAHESDLAAVQDQAVEEETRQSTDSTRVLVLKNQALQALARKDIEGAMSFYRQAIALVPNDAGAYYELALLDDKLGRAAEERSLLQEAAAKDSHYAAAAAQLGFLDMRAGQRQAAETHLLNALSSNPQCVEALGNLGVLYAQEGRSADALHLLELATEADDTYQMGYVNLGLVEAATGNYSGAAASLHRAIALKPNDAVAQNALRAVEQGTLASNTGR